jgi:phage-related baseplate assembly protein
MTSHNSIIDVSVSSPSLGVIKICPLIEGGALPSQEVLDAVQAVVDSDTRRPLTDQVVTVAPEAVSFSVALDYWIETSASALTAQIQEAVAVALADYVDWQVTKMGRDINPSMLIAKIQAVSGVKRVVVNSPVFAAVATDQVASLSGSATASYQGLEDE